MTTGVQFNGSLSPNQTHQWYTWGWPASDHVFWYMMPTSPANSSELTWNIAVQRTSATQCTYWITVTNQTGNPINFEGRYAILN
ncbi:MAG TPA: hypothetical protein VMI35_00970 [Puia sp.]|nr:hypothetical protein [Puia sp.]